MKLLRNICRILVGIVFIYSGFVKGVDPLGSDYKFTDYFNAFGMSWMGFSTLFFSFLLSMAEFLIGICLFLNIKIKTAAWGAILFMGFFTPLTLILAIKNPVTDCGCFGDALILTNWETFWKNIILLAMTLVIFYTRDKYKPIFNFLEQTVVLVGTVIFMFCVQWYSFRHLPIVDFRPYAIGKNISEGMAIPDGAPHDEYAITLKYKNKQTGEVKDFTEENYPWQDTVNWEYVSSDQKLIKDYQRKRIMAFLYPENEEYSDDIEQQNNSKTAIASGELIGKKLSGDKEVASVNDGNFVSENQTDFIFAVAGEEYGFMGCCSIVILLLAISVECIRMSLRAKDLSGKIICCGMASIISLQSFLNICVATGIAPNTGTPLPFVSYGLTSLISLYIGMGMVLNVGLQSSAYNKEIRRKAIDQKEDYL